MRVPFLVAALIAALPGRAVEQADSRLLRRWVGTHAGVALHLDFYGDTMLVVNDDHALDYRATRDSIVATGDTSIAAAYWFALDRLLLRTANDEVITMSEQSALARPLHGRWRGAPARWTDREVELIMTRGGGARWRRVPGGGWVQGEWERATRLITFTWLPDSVMWSGRYDPAGNALLFEDAPPGEGPMVLRRVFR
jgi:hypothetical protein